MPRTGWSFFVLFGTLCLCATTEPSGNQTRNLTVWNPVSKHCAAIVRSRLECSTPPINDIVRIFLFCLVCYFHTENMVGPGIHDFPLDEQLTVDFIHRKIWLLKNFVYSGRFCWNFQLDIHHYSVQLKARTYLEHRISFLFCLKHFSSAHQRSVVGTEFLISQLESRSHRALLTGSAGAHCWRVPKRTKQLSSAPVSFQLSNLLINDEFVIVNHILCLFQISSEITGLYTSWVMG